MRTGLIWAIIIASITTAARATALQAGWASPLVWPGAIFTGLLVALYLHSRRRPLPDRRRDALTVAVSLDLIGFLGLRVLADDVAGGGSLRLGPPIPIAMLCAAQFVIPWRLFWPVLGFGGILTAVGATSSGATYPLSPRVYLLVFATVLAAAAIRWAVGKDETSRQEAAHRERLASANLVGVVDQLRRSEIGANRTRAVIEQVTAGMPLGVLVHDYESDAIVYGNGRNQEIWKYPDDASPVCDDIASDFEAQMQRCVDRLIDPEPFLNLQQVLRRDRSGEVHETELSLKDGRTLRYFSVFIRDEFGRDFGRLHAAEDITARKRAEQTEIRFGLAARCANDGLFDWDRATGLAHYSDRWKDMLGYRADEIGHSPREAFRQIHPQDRKRVLGEFWDHIHGRTQRFDCEFRMRSRSGEYVWMLGRGLALRDGDDRAYRMAGSLTDITTRKLAEMRLRHDAEHDVLTGLSNRSRFRALLSAHLVAVRSQTAPSFAVLFLDVDRFKVVNDSIGHAAGDELLVTLAQMLREAAPPGAEVARLGGDEFAMLLPGVASEVEALAQANTLQRNLSEPIHLRGQEIVFSSSIGVAWGTRTYQSPEDLLRDADLAMYRAKKQGGGSSALFQQEMHASALRTLEIQSALQKSIERNELSLVWQPIYGCSELRIIGVEALLRWSSPRLGPLGPSEFIPVAEEIGFIDQLDAWVFETACGQMRQWRSDGIRDLQLAVNLSARGLMEPGLATRLSKTAATFDLAPNSITVEITETGLIENLDRAGAALERLAGLGFQIALDDFGTGYSSLNYIRRLPINILKIAGSLADDICCDPRSGALTKLVIDTAHTLGLEVISERVETEEQFAFLRQRRCDAAQGFYLSRPVHAAAITQLASRPWRPARKAKLRGAPA